MDSKHKSYTSSTLKEIMEEYVREERVINKLSGGLQMEERPPPNKRIKPWDMDLGKGGQKPEGRIVKEKEIIHRKSLSVLRFWAWGNSRLLLRSLMD